MEASQEFWGFFCLQVEQNQLGIETPGRNSKQIPSPQGSQVKEARQPSQTPSGLWRLRRLRTLVPYTISPDPTAALVLGAPQWDSDLLPGKLSLSPHFPSSKSTSSSGSSPTSPWNLKHQRIRCEPSQPGILRLIFWLPSNLSSLPFFFLDTCTLPA